MKPAIREVKLVTLSNIKLEKFYFTFDFNHFKVFFRSLKWLAIDEMKT